MGFGVVVSGFRGYGFKGFRSEVCGERFGVFGFSLGFRIKVQGLDVYRGN